MQYLSRAHITKSISVTTECVFQRLGNGIGQKKLNLPLFQNPNQSAMEWFIEHEQD